MKHILNWILGKAILNKVLNESFLGKILTLNWIKWGIEHPYQQPTFCSTKCHSSRRGCGETRKVQNSDCLQWFPGFRPQSFKVCTATSCGRGDSLLSWTINNVASSTFIPKLHTPTPTWVYSLYDETPSRVLPCQCLVFFSRKHPMPYNQKCTFLECSTCEFGKM